MAVALRAELPPERPQGWRRAKRVRVIGDVPRVLRRTVLQLAEGDLNRCIRQADGQVSVYASAELRDAAWTARRRRLHAAHQRAYTTRQRRNHLHSVPAQPDEATAAAQPDEPATPQPPAPAARADLPRPAGPPRPPTIVSTRAHAEDDEWWNPATGELAMPISEAVALRAQHHAAEAEREAARQAALQAAQARAAQDAAHRARRELSVAAQREQRHRQRRADRRHGRLGLHPGAGAAHQVVLGSPASQALAKLERTGDRARLRKVVGALEVLRTVGPAHPSLRTKRLAGQPGVHDDGRAVFQSNVENGTPSAWRIRWCWGADPDGGSVIDVVQLGPHDSGGWSGGGAR